MLDDPDVVLAALDPEQREVALADRGPVCVLAGAGTGKTRAIAYRIAYAVRAGLADPGHVLALTFTVRAAGELRERLRRLGGPGMERVQARTFHAAALRQLRHFWPAAVGGPPPALMDSKLGLLMEAARAVKVRTNLAGLRDVATEIEWAKVMQVRPHGYAASCAAAGRTPPLPAETTARLFAAYEEVRRERHLVDFESVLELTAGILAGYRQAATEVADRYRDFVVDEYQDVNPLQKLLLDAWLGGRDNLCVVGDPRQTIYSFTGATPAYLTGFTAEFPRATVIRLVRNYRSSPQVVTLANRLVGAAGGRRLPAAPLLAGPAAERGAARATGRRGAGAEFPGGPPLVAQCPPGPAPEFAAHDDDVAEAAAVAARAGRLVAEGVPAGQIAVLVRTNAQTERFERALTEAGVPFAVRGTQSFFDRPEVRQAMGLLRAALKSTRAAGQRVPSAPSGENAAEEVRHVLAGLGLTRQPPAGAGAASDRWESLATLAHLAEEASAIDPGAGLAGVVAELTRRAASNEEPAAEGVTVTSLHAAKGLEWDVVFLPGLTEGNLPIVHAQSGEAMAEERRLLYVGVTRARQRLFLSWSLARSPGGPRTRSPSRFLDGLRGGGGRQRPGGAAAGPGPVRCPDSGAPVRDATG